MLRVLIVLVSLGARALRAVFRRRADIVMENLALRQQVTTLKKERPLPAPTTSIGLSGSPLRISRVAQEKRRRRGLKIPYRKVCGFDSHPRYHALTNCSSIS